MKSFPIKKDKSVENKSAYYQEGEFQDENEMNMHIETLLTDGWNVIRRKQTYERNKFKCVFTLEKNESGGFELFSLLVLGITAILLVR
jgi:hypothetical protein